MCPRRKPRIDQAVAELENLAKRIRRTPDIPPRPGPRPARAGRVAQGCQSISGRRSQLREAIRLREEIAGLPDATAEDKQAHGRQPVSVGGAPGLAADRARPRGTYGEYQLAVSGSSSALVKQFGDRPEYRTKLVRYRNNLAILQRAMGSLSESETALRATLELVIPAVESRIASWPKVASFSCLQQSRLAASQRAD